MLLTVEWDGAQIPFEGDRTIHIRTIPEGAKVVNARVAVTPVDPGASTVNPNDSFVEHIVFSGAGPTWGANRVQGADFVEVDFRARRTMAAAQISGVNAAFPGTLQIDPGGAYVEINEHGAIFTPGDTRFGIKLDGLVSLPSFVVARFKIARIGAAAPNITEVQIRSVPENVSLRLGSDPVFHTFLGLMTAPEESIDFANLLGEFLGSAKVENGFYDVPLTVHSDSISRLQIKISLDVQQAQKPLQNVPESVMGFHVDAIPVGAATQFQFDLPVGSAAVAGRSAVRFQGAFDDTRIAFGPLAPELTGLEVDITPEANRPQAQAQPFTLPKNLNIIGIDLLLTPQTDTADVLVDIRDDLSGKPGLHSLLPAPLKITVRRKPADDPQWLTTPLPAELPLSQDQPLWLVVQRQAGKVTWSVQPSTTGPGLQQTTDEALSWQKTAAGTAPQLEAFFRLRHRPPQFTMPIHVFIGQGNDRQEVPLKQFEPLGRVDFVLDTEEFAATINQVAAKTAAQECQAVEHLLNGDLEEWLKFGTAIKSAGVFTVEDAQAMVLAPDAREVYTAQMSGTSQPIIRVLDPLCLRETVQPLTLSRATQIPPSVSLAVNASGSRLFFAIGRRIWIVDAAAMKEIGFADLPDGTIFNLAAGGGKVFVLAGLFQNLGTAPDPSIPQIFSISEAELENSLGSTLKQPSLVAPVPGGRAIAVTADGRTLCAVSASLPNADGKGPGPLLHVVSAPASRSPIPLGFEPGGITLSPDGKSAYLTVLVASTVTNRGPAISGAPAAAPPATPVIHRVDLTSGNSTDVPITITGVFGFHFNIVSLAAITGDRLAILRVNPAFLQTASSEPLASAAVEILNFGLPVPKWWDITAGGVRPVRLPAADPAEFDLGAWLGTTPLSASPLSAFSQVVPVTAGCLYEFSFRATATSLGAAGDILWRGDQCTATRTDTIPIDSPGKEVPFCSANIQLTQHRLRVRAPEGATQAEVRFRATDGVNAVINAVSLKPPDGPLTNEDFQPSASSDLPDGWTLDPVGAPGFVFQNGEIKNIGVDAFTLLQNVTVTPGRPFRLEFTGEVQAAGTAPTAAVHWQGTADPVVLELVPGEIGLRVAAGKVPDGVTSGEVSLTLPSGSSIRPDHFLLRTGVTTGLVFSVFAEAPGELIVSQFQIVSDVKPAVPPAIPPTGLCPPTKPGSDPDAPDECAYCPSCGEETEMTKQKATAVISGRPGAVTTTVCKNCGGATVRPGAPAGTPTVATTRPIGLLTFPLPRRPVQISAAQAFLALNTALGPTRVVTPKRFIATPVVAAPPAFSIHAVRGIGKAEMASLEAAGITTLDQLLTHEPEELAAILPTGTVNRARLLLGLARKAREEAAAVGPAPAMRIPSVPVNPEMPQSALRAIRGIGRRETESLEAAGISTVDQVVALTPEKLASLSGSTVPRARMLLGLARKLKESEPPVEAEPKEGLKPEREPEPESSPKVEPE